MGLYAIIRNTFAGGYMSRNFVKSYGSMLPSEARELKHLREENARLKRVVADLTLDKVMLQDVVQKKF
jgi:putative transposase